MNRQPDELDAAEAAEKHVADEIEHSIIHAASIEEELLLESAELEEIVYHEPSL